MRRFPLYRALLSYLPDDIADLIHHIGVIARAANHRIAAKASIQAIVASAAIQGLLALLPIRTLSKALPVPR